MLSPAQNRLQRGTYLIPELIVKLIKNGSSVEIGSDGPHRRRMKSGWILVLSALCGLALRAWPQSASLPGPDSGNGAGLSSGSEAETSANQPLADASMLGSIHGVVSNRDGSVYEGAHVALALTAAIGPIAKTAISDSDGRFSFIDVAAGPFKLTISSSGFSTQVISGVLHAGESYEAQAIVLPLSTATSDVWVTASTEQIAQAQVIQEEKQRVLGFIPNFYVAYAPDAAPLNSRQKFDLAWKSSIDPFTFFAAGAFAGIEQADNTLSGYGQGTQGYAKRFAANYANTFIGTMIGGAILPSLLKQDPRYFYKGTGTIRSRVSYAIANAVVCKGDNGRWQMNYSGIIGGLAAGGISNLYYPASSRDGAALTFENALLGIAAGAVENLFQEFLVRKLTPKVPKYGPSGP
jgi:Carboxypeptidase regulatory-like domain